MNCAFTNCQWSALWIIESSPQFANCLVYDNRSPQGGAGFYLAVSSATIANCTIVDNAASFGGGIHCEGSDPTITNCVLRGNTPDQISAGDPVVAYCNVQGGFVGEGNIDHDPLFLDPENDNYRIGAGSSCIDAGKNDAVPAGVLTDLDGNRRFVDDPGMPDHGDGQPPIVDMGAYEFQGETCFGDLDGDNNVGLSDLAQLLTNYGTASGAAYIDGDLDIDGDVDLADLSALLARYGEVCP